MGRQPKSERAARIYANCEKIAELLNIVAFLKRENTRLEWLETLDDGIQITFAEFKSQLIAPIHWRKQPA